MRVCCWRAVLIDSVTWIDGETSENCQPPVFSRHCSADARFAHGRCQEESSLRCHGWREYTWRLPLQKPLKMLDQDSLQSARGRPPSPWDAAPSSDTSAKGGVPSTSSRSISCNRYQRCMHFAGLAPAPAWSTSVGGKSISPLRSPQRLQHTSCEGVQLTECEGRPSVVDELRESSLRASPSSYDASVRRLAELPRQRTVLWRSHYSCASCSTGFVSLSSRHLDGGLSLCGSGV